MGNKYAIEHTDDVSHTGLSRKTVEEAFDDALRRAFADRTPFRIDREGTAAADAGVDKTRPDAAEGEDDEVLFARLKGADDLDLTAFEKALAKELGFDIKQFRKERDAIPLVKDAQGRLLAANGQPSNIQNEKLWQTVRHPNFKRWFGEWQAGYRKNKLLHGPAVRVVTTNTDRKTLFEEARRKHQGKIVHNDDFGRDIHITREGLKHAKAWSQDVRKAQSLLETEQIIREGVYLGEEPNRKSDPNIRAYHHLATPVSVNGQKVIVETIVRETTSGELFYDFNVADTVNPAGSSSGAKATRDLNTQPSAGYVSTLLQKLLDFNENNVSKVVDENGEPLVVYSGHNNLEMYGDRYDPKRGIAGGFYASESAEVGSGYSLHKSGTGPYDTPWDGSGAVAKRKTRIIDPYRLGTKTHRQVSQPCG